MKRRPGVTQRQALARTSAQGWRASADVVAALKALEREPLPRIAPETLDAVGVRHAFKRAYLEHPVYAAAIEWSVAERGGSTAAPIPGSEVGHALTYVSVHAMRRYFRDRDPAPF